MAEVAEVWKSTLPKMLEGVTGVGVWTALKSAVPIAVEDGVFVLGVPAGTSDLGGHLRVPQTTRVIETIMAQALSVPVRLRVIDGTTNEDWEIVKRKDAERRRMQQAQMDRERAELASRTSWESVYEQLARRNSAMQNRSMPQNRARFFDEACAIVAEARREMTTYDDMAERNFARCIERVAQYCDVSSTLVGLEVLRRAGEI